MKGDTNRMIKANDILRAQTADQDSTEVEASKAGRVMAAYQALRNAIRSNVFPPGYQAAENEIARQLGMSRTPVHEAMARLQEDGLVRILPKKGIIIRALSPADIEEIYEVIIALEGAAAARIAGFPEPERLTVAEALRQATQEMDDALKTNDLQAWAAADEVFHETLVERSGNSRLRRMAGTVADQLHRARMFTLNLRPLPAASSAEHAAIVKAIETGNKDVASDAARIHRNHARDQLLPLIERLNLRNL